MKRSNRSLAWLIPFFKPYSAILLLVGLLAFVSTALQLSYPYLSKVFIDDVLLQPTYPLRTILTLTFALTVGGIVLQAVNSYLYLRVTLRIIQHVRLYVFRHVARLPQSFFTRTPIGDITTRLSGDVNIVHGTLTDGVLQLCMTLITLIFITGMLIFLDWQLFVYTLVVFPLFVLVLFVFRPLITKKTAELRRDQSAIQGHMIETFRQMRLVKLTTAEREREEQLNETIDTLNRHSLQYAIIESVAGGIPQLLTIGVTTFILAVGGKAVLDGQMTIGSLLAFTTYLGRFFSPVQTLAGLYIRFQNMYVSLDRLVDYLHLPTEHDASHRRDRIAANDALLTMDEVSAAHDGRPIIERASMTLHAGHCYAMTGASGAGKSTLLDAMTGLIPYSGTITYSGVDGNDIARDVLRRYVAVVSQQTELMRGTVRDNVTLGLTAEERAAISDEQIEAYCRTFGLHESIMSWDAQYETTLGEQGHRLSGGQRERLAIIRALLRHPHVLILDESTSGSDHAMERLVYEQLKRWVTAAPHRTVLIISHRTQTLDWCERWWTVRNGQLIESATYAQWEQEQERKDRDDDTTENREGRPHRRAR